MIGQMGGHSGCKSWYFLSLVLITVSMILRAGQSPNGRICSMAINYQGAGADGSMFSYGFDVLHPGLLYVAVLTQPIMFFLFTSKSHVLKLASISRKRTRHRVKVGFESPCM
ncbi:uncharacterized protein B0I36DRAFT_2910 [Microdochium trichocladiopsis]|uniref:Uncharacterized protein n=1 Tax=Microdochium trichocladiopsis TaxID=1682393 RepID=A0A9P9BVS0_9PEZI|nr:uncharacterized protein B0I36DRAFT_2910 [Microdochium trichocladiopsis]KAH7039855.1 hypothetical protein B0I36DRAFT_2910 [Microdochium trichocladiopsis]